MDSTNNLVNADDKNALQTALAAGMLLAAPRTVSFAPRQRAYVLVPDGNGGFKIEFVDPPAKPPRATGTYIFDNIESFISFASNNKGPHALAFARSTPLKVELFSVLAVLNEAEKDEPSFRDYRALLAPPVSESYTTWMASNGKKFDGNEAFAEFLEDHFTEIVEPDGATIMELATNFHAKAEVTFGNPINLQDGSVQLTKMKTVTGGANAPSGQVVIPKKIVIEIEVLRGEEKTYQFEAHFRFRLENNGGVKIWYQLIRPDLVIEEVFADACARIRDEAGLPVMFGEAGFTIGT